MNEWPVRRNQVAPKLWIFIIILVVALLNVAEIVAPDLLVEDGQLLSLTNPSRQVVR